MQPLDLSELLRFLIPLYGLLFLFYIPLLIYIRRRRKYRVGRDIFYRGVKTVFENCQDDADCVPQIQLLHKRLLEQFSQLKDDFRSAVDMMEDLIFSYDTMKPETFKETFGVQFPPELRPRIVNTLNLMKVQHPFSSLSSKESNLFNMLKHAIDTQNSDLAVSSLNQLADEVEVLEKNLNSEAKRTNLSFIISAIGVILTIFFGIVSFIQFIS